MPLGLKPWQVGNKRRRAVTARLRQEPHQLVSFVLSSFQTLFSQEGAVECLHFALQQQDDDGARVCMQVQMCSFLQAKKAKRDGVLGSTGTVQRPHRVTGRKKNGNRTDRTRRFVGVGYGSTADFRSGRTQGQSGLAPSNLLCKSSG